MLSFEASSSPNARCFLVRAQTSTPNVKISNENEARSKLLEDVDFLEPKDVNFLEPKDLNFLESQPSNLKKDKSVPITRSKTTSKGKDPKTLNSLAAQRRSLDFFQILKYPLATESATELVIKHNTLVFVVDKHADKNNIKEAVKRTLNVTAKRVNTLMMPDGNKKAYIKLVPECSALDLAKKTNIF